QIARSHGLPRQTVQLAISSLIGNGLVVAEPNPDHRRAVLLRVSPEGAELKNRIDARGVQLANEFLVGIDSREVRQTTASLCKMRKAVELRMRTAGEKKSPAEALRDGDAFKEFRAL